MIDSNTHSLFAPPDVKLGKGSLVSHQFERNVKLRLSKFSEFLEAPSVCMGMMTRKCEVALDLFELQDKGSMDGEFNGWIQ